MSESSDKSYLVGGIVGAVVVGIAATVFYVKKVREKERTRQRDHLEMERQRMVLERMNLESHPAEIVLTEISEISETSEADDGETKEQELPKSPST
jgi:hypothetical protein